ncbi:hypothetical protein T265_09121 [Opisthorchis viverrini]|uniref:Uncharacterized protein n=1 Tax=Opisthorchis viverrini TaxID=6198 RepID=A0A074Z6N3_OPIVI|nr:hypothetical protein T265_09121 [Opisthorchis viverrini]KER22846.1 hypothetical protein T265_09121 [Opisthorchis viverrini]
MVPSSDVAAMNPKDIAAQGLSIYIFPDTADARVMNPECLLPQNDRTGSKDGHKFALSERQPLTDKNKTDPGNLGKSLDPVYQSVNP